MDSRKGKCQVVESWTFSELVGAFLDLAIAYLLLCGAAMAYLASKFLGLFGLGLPCPCNGLFWSPRRNRCLQKALVYSPSETISAIHSSLKSKTPFGSMWTEDQNHRKKKKTELEGEASSSSVAETREKSSVSRYATPKSGSVMETKEKGSVSRYATPISETDEELRAWNSPNMMEGRVYSKGKGVKTQRGRPALRRRGKKPAGGGKFSSVTSYDLFKLNGLDIPLPPFSLNNGSEKTEGSLEPVTSVDGSEAPKDIGWQERSLGESELSETAEENKSVEKNAFTSEQEDIALDCNDKNMIRILEQALEEEHTARTALYSELEKERIAAATATDEAMNMILRLQEEKAAVEMEARQYHRIIEAKSAYDAEEMNIMKEILLRREREKLFLEKEVEAYRQMYFGNEQLDTDVLDFQAMQGEWGSSLYSNEDPMLMLQGISDSIDEKNKMNVGTDFADRDELRGSSCSIGNEVVFTDPKDQSLPFGDKLQTLGLDEVVVEPTKYQEKGMVTSMEENPFTQQNEAERLGEGDMDSSSLVSNKESLLRDDGHVIVIDDEVTSNDFIMKKGDQSSVDDSIYTPTYCDSPPMRRLSSEHDRSRSGSEILSGFPPLGLSRGKASLSGSRRSSMSSLELRSYNDSPWLRTCGSERGGTGRSSTELSSGLPPLGPSRGKASGYDFRRRSLSALDNERMKLETEVKWLREKLKVVQKGREKLSVSVERKDQEKVQFKLLDDIASQLREIRQLTEPGKATLPPLSKVKSKKRRCRSASLDVSGNS